MKWIDSIAEKSARAVARRTSRRSFAASVGAMLTGAALLPLLPFDRSGRALGAEAPPLKPTDDPQSCEYWKYCALDGFLCSCCGGSSHSCPAGTTPSPITWIGTCHNPVDSRD